MLKRTNILALVGGGKAPYYPPNKLIIWDDHQGKIISKLRFNENILNVRLRNDKIITVLENKIYIFNLNTLETITTLDTYTNPTGIIGISNGDNNKLILAYPFESQGNVLLKDIISLDKIENTQTQIIKAHDSGIACISVNKDGTLLATSSDKGTLIRIFSTADGGKLSEFRRGTTYVEMNHISFDLNNKFIGCTSNVGTIHFFSLSGIMKTLNENNEENKNERKNSEEEPKNTKSLLGKIGGLFGVKSSYLDTERYFAKFKVQEEYSLLGFGLENTIIIITMDGKYYKAAYDPKKGGDCCQIESKNIFDDN